MNPEMFKRMRNASKNEEEPIVLALTSSKKVKAWKNTDVTTQKQHGDIIFSLETENALRSIESQCSSTHANFSYGLSKHKKYEGPGAYEHAYVMLGCLQSKNSKDMFYLICQAKYLHDRLTKKSDEYLSKDGKYYIIGAGSLHDLDGIVAVGSSIEEVVANFVDELTKEG